jgi:hypothetical protein
MIVLYTSLLYSNVGDQSKGFLESGEKTRLIASLLRSREVMEMKRNNQCPIQLFSFGASLSRRGDATLRRGCTNGNSTRCCSRLLSTVVSFRYYFLYLVIKIGFPTSRVVITVISTVHFCFATAIFLPEYFSFSQR